ncbi:hypothetical protein Q4603_07260 [Zobellia galactanivorans]|uniref:Conserved hypothetical periplasmic protein n=1 Tax=Zobellia galactanivorans (strain DSM 12802 / CCUG 47099 / CIP 106680 / NCIMB 13871 / Dsij) TaxID=63186 RepID=G0LAL1_ZOBGA|nr:MULTISPECIES: hypothetical protein [Zobellia]MBU3028119.1 hypothetical protein [Zobellia galactanivorans]MDO6515806.1 hypothetical protein [Zobellia uliginosa]MDO6808400.1 hypothetical protein [Zobellia galactanivorans]OWW26462.1 hypothetical protein B4Q04_01905 [Zobellia sp. OII3]CAZ95403.1 Conserved hypothetical periplasmic protein [Zobellia galactanivorans]
MKNLMFAAVLSLGTMTAFAQEEETVVEETVATEVVEAQDAFAEVAVEEVPAAISEALEAAHPGATISKAFMNEDAQYKLEVAKEDGETAELYADAEGNWIEK